MTSIAQYDLLSLFLCGSKPYFSTSAPCNETSQKKEIPGEKSLKIIPRDFHNPLLHVNDKAAFNLPLSHFVLASTCLKRAK